MLKKVCCTLVRTMAIALLFFSVFDAAHAQQAIAAALEAAHPQETIMAETTPNAIKLVGAFRNEAVIEADVINQRIPCQPSYPKSSIRNNEMGTVKLKLLINANGYVIHAKVVETSGFRDLDRAAMIGFMGCRFKSTVKDGVATENWIDMKYVWKID